MTIYIIAITCIISAIAFSQQEVFDKLKFNAYAINGHREWYRFFTYAFIHADFFHLLVNMYVLYSFGGMVEYFYAEYFEEKAAFYYILLYAGATFTSVIPSFEKNKNNGYYNAVGASGAVSAIVFSCILFSPTMPMGLLFLPFNFPAILFGGVYLFYSYYMAKKGTDNVGHDAHFFGALFGVMFTILLNKEIAIHFYQQLAEFFFN